MEIQHNNTELTRVRATPGAHQSFVHFDYPAREEQLAGAISQSEHCEQELSYHCRKSRLLNTPGNQSRSKGVEQQQRRLFLVTCEGCGVSEGSPFSWWLGGPGPGRVQTYWGGAQPGSQQCACGLQGNCVDPQHYCNCDADRVEW